jgi:quercetin dioxygenase-like cupin family protein
MTRMLVSAAMGARQLCQFEQWSAPGAGAPTHHHAVEEIVTILAGQAEFWLDGQTTALAAGQSLIVPAGHPHGFRNSGTTKLHTLATLAAPIFEAAYEDARETPRRWTPQ